MRLRIYDMHDHLQRQHAQKSPVMPAEEDLQMRANDMHGLLVVLLLP